MDKYVVRLPAPESAPHLESPRADGEKPTCVELFAGAGGMALGLAVAGFEHVALIERDRNCVYTLRQNGFGRCVKLKDARVVDYSRWKGVDLVAGGPPCQPFSQGGHNKGKDDSRDGWPIVIRAVSQIRPRAFVFENVVGMTRDRFATYFQSVLKRFWDLGYGVHVHVVDAADYGVPQHRRRVIMVGFRGAKWFPKPPPTVAKHVTVGEMMEKLGPPTGKNGHVLRNGAQPREYAAHVASTLHKPSRALTAGTHGPGGGNLIVKLGDGTRRYFTMRELACLQTFPTSYKLPTGWCQGFRQMGNACPVKLAEVFGVAILGVLNKANP